MEYEAREVDVMLDVETLAGRAETLRSLHHASAPLLLPNVWDATSAGLVAAKGFPALATSSGAVAASLGYRDDDSMPPDEAFAAITRVGAAADLPLTADIESGYRLAPGELAERLLEAGAQGCNFEDTDHHGAGGLLDPAVQAERIAALEAAARASGVDLVLNARVDVFLGRDGVDAETVDEAVRRARLYVEAGADCVFPIMLADERAIRDFVQAVPAPVNIFLRSGAPSVARLRELGVKRISMGSRLMRTASRAIEQELENLRSEFRENAAEQ